MSGFYGQMENYLRAGRFWTATVLDGPEAGEKAAWRGEALFAGEKRLEKFWHKVMTAASGENHRDFPGVIETDGGKVYVEHLMQEPELVICGGGHISLEVAFLAGYMEYPYVVLDDRAEFCSPDRFPGAKECICAPFADGLGTHTFSADAYYIIVTRGHKADLECLELILQRPSGYVGMIGSRGKVARTMTVLREKGYPEEQLAQIHAPIGLKIGGETPKEIGVSILSQIIQEKNRGNAAVCLDQKMVRTLSDGEPGVLVTITGKRGSAPRGAGSRMIVGEREIICGTIGGGMVEYEAEKKAREYLAENRECPVQTETYLVNNTSAAALGMWCGGEVDVMIERL